MKSKLNLILLILTIFQVHSQQKGILNYGYIESLDIGNAKGFNYNAYLMFNNEQSNYVTAKDSLENTNNLSDNKTYSNDDGDEHSIHLGVKVSKNGDQVVYNLKKNTIWSSLYCGTIFYVKEVASNINWIIEKETKKIGKFTCKKATTNFRGRNYTAWFTSEIPLKFGPWKLNGLPGLILEAYDTNKFVYWYFKSVEYPTKVKETINYMKVPKNVKILNYNDFKNIQIEQIEKCSDKLKIAKKQYPNVEFFPPKLKDMFIECE